MAQFIRFLLRQRALATTLVLVSLALSIYSARTIRLRFQFRDFFDYPGNPHLEVFRRDNDEFGDPAGFVVAMVQADDVFRKDVLEYVAELTTALKPEPLFVRIRSLSNVSAMRGSNDEVASGPLMPSIPETPEALAELKRFVMQSALLRRRLISADGKTTAVLAEMRTPAQFSSNDEQRQALDAVKRALAKHPAPAGVDVRVTGAPAVEVGTTDSLMKDQTVLTPAVLGVLVLVLFITFRSFHGILLCLTSVNVATIWTAGIFALFQRPVDIVGSIIPTTILVYGVVDPIFVLTRVLSKLETGLDKDDAIVEALRELGLPCFLSSLTTALGFAAFLTARAPTIRYYGLTVAIGVALAFVTTITVLPLLLSAVPRPRQSFAQSTLSRWVDRAIVFVWGVLKPRAALAIALSIAFVAVGGFLARNPHVDNEYINGLPRDQQRTDVRLMEQKLAGVVRFVVYLEGAPDSMKRPDVVKAIEAVDKQMEKNPAVTLSISLADLIGEANQAFAGGDPEERRVPSSRSLIAQYLAMIDPGDRSDFVSDDYAKSHIAILVKDSGSEGARALRAQLERVVESAGFAALGVTASLTGNGVVNYVETDRAVYDMIEGYFIAFAIVLVFVFLLFRSLRVALICIIPNLIPVLVCFLVLRTFGIHMKLDNSLVLCISIGGLFNTTIHFIARVRQRVAAGDHDPDSATLHAMRSVGPAALFTSVTLSAGFAVLLFSSFPGLQALGFLSMITLLVGFLSDMIITPVLMRVGFNWKKAVRESTPPMLEPALPSSL